MSLENHQSSSPSRPKKYSRYQIFFFFFFFLLVFKTGWSKKTKFSISTFCSRVTNLYVLSVLCVWVVPLLFHIQIFRSTIIIHKHSLSWLKLSLFFLNLRWFYIFIFILCDDENSTSAIINIEPTKKKKKNEEYFSVNIKFY